jgi:hypothetical protein
MAGILHRDCPAVRFRLSWTREVLIPLSIQDVAKTEEAPSAKGSSEHGGSDPESLRDMVRDLVADPRTFSLPSPSRL